jgi:superfamily II DNA or RNA helicase
VSDYKAFINAKLQHGADDGFAPIWMPDFLFDFQKHMVEWAVRKGRAAIFADCGLGKTAMQLVWAENVVRRTNMPVLILTPLAVSYQTVAEAEKFSIGAVRNIDGSKPGGILVTNYEHLTKFNPGDFGGVVCDESSILKNFNGARRKEITEFMRKCRYRLCCTATAAPNDYHELGTTSDALGYLGARDMLTMFFKEDVSKDYLAWGRKTYRFRGHAELPFFRWVCSWSRACRKPSDLGYTDAKFKLPKLIEEAFKVNNSTPRDGMLFAIPANGLEEQREERRITVRERCEAAAANVLAHDGASVVWCHLNQEGDELEKAIPGALQVSGQMSEELKEERLLAFQTGQLKCLITKPKIGCFGLNWQHCSNVVTFPSHSWEQYYQAVRRCWRFGQKKPVKVTVITTDGEQDVMSNLQRKAKQADRMFDLLVQNMGQALRIDRGTDHKAAEVLPSWMASTKETVSCQ